MLMIATFGTVIQCIDFINQAYEEQVIGLDSLFQFLADFNGLIYVVAVLWLVYIAILFLKRKISNYLMRQALNSYGCGVGCWWHVF